MELIRECMPLASIIHQKLSRFLALAAFKSSFAQFEVMLHAEQMPNLMGNRHLQSHWILQDSDDHPWFCLVLFIHILFSVRTFPISFSVGLCGRIQMCCGMALTIIVWANKLRGRGHPRLPY